MEKTLNIINCCHKVDLIAKQPYFTPIQVGKANSLLDLGIQGDDTGENISTKNDSYCELTGLYWIWKNHNDAEVIGLSHYRRYFDFHGQCETILPFTRFKTSQFNSLDYSVPKHIWERIKNGSVVLARPTHYSTPLFLNYASAHVSDDLRILEYVIKKTQPENVKRAYYNLFYKKNKLSPYNMFLMNHSDFNTYCKWLFGILEDTEKLCDIEHYNPVQKRIYGYMAERLLNVWVEAQKKTVIYAPVMIFDDGGPRKLSSPFRFFMGRLRNDISTAMISKTTYAMWSKIEVNPYYIRK